MARSSSGGWVPSGELQALRWTDGGQHVNRVGPDVRGISSQTLCLNHDGSVVGGFLSDEHGPVSGFLWSRGGGLLDVAALLSAHGVDLTGWTLTTLIGMSADGTVIAGTGRHGGRNEAWIARLPVGC